MSKDSQWKELKEDLTSALHETGNRPENQELKCILQNHSSADIALALEELEADQAIIVFEALEKSVSIEVLAKMEPERTNEILKKHPERLRSLLHSLAPRDAATVLTDISNKLNSNVKWKKKLTDPKALDDVNLRLCYPKGSVGRLMTSQFIWLHREATVFEAIELIRQTDPAIDIPDDVYVVDAEKQSGVAQNRLLGVISIRGLLMCNSDKKVEDVMSKDVVSVNANIDELDAAAVLSKYKFLSIPVTDNEGYLVGVVPAEDLMAVIEFRLRKLYNQAVGTDAETMEKLSPFHAAKLRVPWLLGTMVIELGAGLIISHYNSVLQKVILLASFMPVISAISGNVGLQAAAITVRALDTNSSSHRNVWPSLKKEAMTTFLMALTCGAVLGTIGAVWAKHLPFGIVIGIALSCSMLTAGLMGTIIPSVSKRMGFDPATTAGPFETAFQDIVGFAVFLGLATMLQHWIS